MVAGYANNGTAVSTDDHEGFAVARYNPNGTLDTSFGTRGRVTTDIGTGSADRANAVAIDGSGNIVVAGRSSSDGMNSNNDFVVVRDTSTGALDTGLDTDGKVTSEIESIGPALRRWRSRATERSSRRGRPMPAPGTSPLWRGTPPAAPWTPLSETSTTAPPGRAHVLNVIGVLTGGANAVALDGSGSIVTAGNFTNLNDTPDGDDDHDGFAVARYNRRRPST